MTPFRHFTLDFKVDILCVVGIKLYNTLSQRKEEFEPLREREVGIYVCGITVYDLCHIGHARSQIAFDVIVRYLRYRGFNVKYVRNFTDVDDKIIKRANEEGINWKEIAEKYIQEFYSDFEKLNMIKPDVEPRVTEHIEDIIEVVKILIEKGYAYVVDGNVYFSVKMFKEYGKLSKRSPEEMLAGARVEVDENKRDPLDFALWKKSKEGEPAWDSPWGKGRPGWHIECTVMSTKYLGRSFDIHGGGMDLIFPHHENEIAQAESAFGGRYVKYWVHNGFVNINKEKMSKSTGLFFTIRDVLQKTDPEVLRFFLLSKHYRSPLDFSEEGIKEAWRALVRYYGILLQLEEKLRAIHSETQKGGEKLGELLRKKFIEAMDDDFNSARAIGEVFDFLSQLSSMEKKEMFSAYAKFKEVMKEISSVLGVFGSEPHEFFDRTNRLLARLKGIKIEEIEALVKERSEYRKARDFQRADEIRERLAKMGIVLEDTPSGTRWRFEI